MFRKIDMCIRNNIRELNHQPLARASIAGPSNPSKPCGTALAAYSVAGTCLAFSPAPYSNQSANKTGPLSGSWNRRFVCSTRLVASIDG